MKHIQEAAAELIPFVIERTGRGERSYDIYSRLLSDRIIMMNSPINDVNAGLYIAQMLYLDLVNRETEIQLYINSPGGSVTAGLAIYDTMQHLNCGVATFCNGQAASMGAILLAGGRAGKRFSLPHSRIMIHQPWGGAEGQASDIIIQAKEIDRLKGMLGEILAHHTGKAVDVLERDMDRDFFMSAEEAKAYGLIDEVLSPGVGPTGTGNAAAEAAEEKAPPKDD